MKFTPLLMLVLVLWGGCQQAHLGCSSELGHVLKEAYNPSLLSLQYLTADMRTENGVWAEARSDYIHVFGDTASVILADFEVLNFKTSGDTLIVNYALKEPRREKEPVVEFIGFQTGKDSPTIKFDNRVQQVKNSNIFKTNEGKLFFFQNNKHEVSIIHEYCGAIARNKITRAHQ